VSGIFSVRIRFRLSLSRVTMARGG
jgi:hypothetical protein